MDWSSRNAQLAFAHGKPEVVATIKQSPEHFLVREIMDVQPSEEGEHIWLWIRKEKQNSDQLAKQLARFCGVAYRDVAYSGQKDYFAVTEQWFSIWLPKSGDPDWSEFTMPGVHILKTHRHSRKIKKGTHRANQFSIYLASPSLGNGKSHTRLASVLEQRFALIRDQGVPNYFGPQRFGREFNNMDQAQSLLSGERRIKDRNLRSLILSAARSWLFNEVVSRRIENSSWLKFYPGEPANLDGTGSIFNTSLIKDSEEAERLMSLDIHPTAPLWGDYQDKMIHQFNELHKSELEWLGEYPELREGLQNARLGYQRRAIRSRVIGLVWKIEAEGIHLKFELYRGQFATSVLRELVQDQASSVTR